MKKSYNIVSVRPLAKFYYKGHHSHPVRRSVLIIEETNTHITGYEIREGSVLRTTQEALNHIKTYKKSKIVRWGDYSRLRMSSKNVLKHPKKTTLEYFPIAELFTEGL